VVASRREGAAAQPRRPEARRSGEEAQPRGHGRPLGVARRRGGPGRRAARAWPARQRWGKAGSGAPPPSSLPPSMDRVAATPWRRIRSRGGDRSSRGGGGSSRGGVRSSRVDRAARDRAVRTGPRQLGAMAATSSKGDQGDGSRLSTADRGVPAADRRRQPPPWPHGGSSALVVHGAGPASSSSTAADPVDLRSLAVDPARSSSLAADPARMTSPAMDTARRRPRRRIQRGAVALVLGWERARRWAREWARRRAPGFFFVFF